MAARLNASHTNEIRQKIQASQLINRLQDHANGKVKMLPTQVRAAEILLKKSVSDLSSVEHAIDPDSNKIVVEVRRFTDGAEQK